MRSRQNILPPVPFLPVGVRSDPSRPFVAVRVRYRTAADSENLPPAHLRVRSPVSRTDRPDEAIEGLQCMAGGVAKPERDCIPATIVLRLGC